MGAIGRLDGFQRRHRILGFPIAVLYKFYDDQGVYLAALVTYYALIAIFPILLLATSTLGFVLEGNPELQEDLLDTALEGFPVLGDQLRAPEGLTGSTPAVLIGAFGALYAALGLGQAAQNAMNTAWGVPRNRRPNVVMSRLRSLRMLGVGGLALLITAGILVVESNRAFFGLHVSGWADRALTLVPLLVNVVMFTVLFRMAPALELRVRDVLPGATLAAVLWHQLVAVGAGVVESVVATASSMNQIFAFVLGLVVWIFVSSVLVVVCVEINVVWVRRLYPRALLSLFTENTDLTEADRVAYGSYVTLHRHKDAADIQVDWAAQDEIPTEKIETVDLSRYRSRSRRRNRGG